jgi:hypothetical protein
LVTVQPFADGNCYQYQYGGTNSANIVQYNKKNGIPECVFYTGENCGGIFFEATGEQCISAVGDGIQSMKCTYFKG